MLLEGCLNWCMDNRQILMPQKGTECVQGCPAANTNIGVLVLCVERPSQQATTRGITESTSDQVYSVRFKTHQSFAFY